MKKIDQTWPNCYQPEIFFAALDANYDDVIPRHLIEHAFDLKCPQNFGQFFLRPTVLFYFLNCMSPRVRPWKIQTNVVHKKKKLCLEKSDELLFHSNYSIRQILSKVAKRKDVFFVLKNF
jgi:hypothetical protein